MGTTVMVIEADPATRHLLGYVLETSGLRPILLDNAEDAVERIPDELPDAIVCEATLPGMDGEEFIERLRSGDLAATPVILLNGDPNEHSADALVDMPFDPFELAQLVERLSSS